MKRFPYAVLCLLLTVVSTSALLGTGAPLAEAAPTPTSYSGSSGGSVANVSVTTGALSLAGVRLADSAATVDSTSTPRSSASSRNLAAAVAGFGVGVDTSSQTAPPDHTSATSGSLAAVSALGIGASAITASDQARWAGDNSCVTDELANAYVRTGGLSVNPTIAGTTLGSPILSTSAGSTRGITSLVGSGLNKAVRGSTTGAVAGVSVLGSIGVEIADTTLSATADGSTAAGTFALTPNTVSYTVDGTTRTLAAGSSQTITLGTVATGQQVVTLTANTPSTSGTGRSATASVTVLTVGVSVKAPVTGSTLATVGVDLLPLRATAAAPAGGIDCPPPVPTISTPSAGSTTSDSTPQISGTGTVGAAVNATVDGVASAAVATVGGDGSWSWSPVTPLADGQHTVSVTQTVNGATSPVSAARTFTIDATAPAAPVITRPTDGSLLGTARPTIAGTAESDSTVVVRVDGTSIGSTTAASGQFSLVPPSDLADGSHTITARATDAAGNVSPLSTAVTVRIDDTAPAVPVLTAPADGAALRDVTPTISGTAEPASTVRAYVDGSVLTATATAGSDGAYRLTSSTLAEGTHTVYVTATDPAGNVSGASPTHTFRIDRTAPSAPVITTPADRSSIATATPTVRGTGEVGAIVGVSVDDTTIGSVQVLPDGSWSLAVTTALADGTHTVAAAQTDAAGNTSVAGSVQFVVDTTAPTAPVITGPADGSVVRGPDFTITGTGEPGASVTVQQSGGAGYGPVTVNGAGSWSVAVTGVADGSATFTARQSDAAGNRSPDSAPVGLTVTSTGPVPPTITSPVSGTATGTAAVRLAGTGVAGATVTVYAGAGTTIGTALVGGDGSWTLTHTFADGTVSLYATQDQGAGPSPVSSSVVITVDTVPPAAVTVTSPVDGSATADRTPTFTGTGEAGDRVRVTLGVVALPDATVAGDGTWSVTAASPLADGTYTARVVQTDPAGNGSPATTVGFEVLTTAPPAPSVDQPADGTTVTDNTPTLAGTGENGDTVAVQIDQNPVGSAVVSGGRWSLTLTTTLAEGAHQVTVVQRGRSGLLSSGADSSFTVDTVAPAAPQLIAPTDNTATNAQTVDLSGTAEPGSTVTVSLNGGVVGTVTADDSGAWHLTTGVLPEGSYTLTATAADPAGNVSGVTGGVTFVVDRTAPAAPVLTIPASGAVLPDSTPTLTGSGEPGAVLAVSVDGGVPLTVRVAGDGSWSLTLTPALIDGPHTLTLLQTDRAGNVSESRATSLTIDTSSPADPVVTAPTAGAVLTGPDVLVTGTGEPGSTLTPTLDGVSLPSVRVASDGNWSVSLTGLADGPHSVSATLADAAGNVSGTVGRAFRVDSTAPTAPVVTAPASGSVIADPTPVVTGTGTGGQTVTVTVDGTAVGTTQVVGSSWTLQLTAALSDGSHTVTATQTDGFVTSGQSTPVGFAVDTVPPAPPVISTPAGGTVTSSQTPTVSGTGENGARVTVYADGTAIGTSTPVTGGLWSLIPSAPLAEGRHRIVAVQTDPAGNPSSGSDPVTFSIDTRAPNPPVITTPYPDAAVADPTPTVAGTGQPGALVRVAVDGGNPIVVTVAGDGSWSLSLPALADGPHTVVASLTGTNGLPATGTAGVSFRVDTTAPAAPLITDPASGTQTDDPTPVIAGTGEPGAVLTLREGSRVLGAVLVGNDGRWSRASAVLAEGQHQLTATQTDPAGNQSSASAQLLLVVDLTAPAAPAIGSPTDGSQWPAGSPLPVTGRGEPGARLILVVDGSALAPVGVGDDGIWSVTLSNPSTGGHVISADQTDPAGNVSAASGQVSFDVSTASRPSAPVISGPADGSSTSDRTPTILGTAAPGAAVAVRLDGVLLGTVTAGGDGLWQIAVAASLDWGGHVLSVAQTVGGATSASATATFTVRPSGGRLAAPTITDPSGRYRSTPISAIGGTGEPGATVSVYIDGAQTRTGTAPVGGNGLWTFPVAPALAEGGHTIRATQTVAGFADSDPAVVAVTVDTHADPPVITAPTNGSTTGDNTPTITGTAEPGGAVTVFVNGGLPRTAAVDGSGRWRLTLATQPDGALSLTAAQTDQAGNVSARSTAVTVTIRTVALPVVTAPRTSVTTPRPVVTGTGQPRAAIVATLTSGSKVVRVGPVTVGSNGRWLLVPPTLVGRSWTVRAAQSISGKPVLLSNTTTFQVVGSNGGVIPVITSPKSGSSFRSPRVTLSGTGKTGTTIALVGNGSHFYGQGPVVKGRWSITTTLRLKSTTMAAVQISPDATERVSKTVTLRVPSISRTSRIAPRVLDASLSLPRPAQASAGGAGGASRSALARTGGPSVLIGLVGLFLVGTGISLLGWRRRQ